jgi:peptidoglycan hydrolase-like protein with peptidoglycan-binding domain
MMNKIVTAACALALGVAWTMAPAIAADDTAKGKMERAKDKTKDGMDTAKDKVGNAVDKTKEKTGETVEKTKDKAADIKDTIKNKVTGSKGSDDVRKAQQALMDKGHNPGPIDGKMGPQTKGALSEYQKKENLKVTGRLDRETKDKLINPASASTKTDTSAPAASPTTTTPSGTSSAPATSPSAADTSVKPSPDTTKPATK